MPNPCLKNTTLTLIHPLTFTSESSTKFTRENLEKWIKHAGGRALTKFTNNTTHVVCTDSAYKHKTGEVRAAVSAREKGERVHIVSPEWLADTLRVQKRGKEGEYSHEKAGGRKGGKAARGGRKKVGGEEGPKTHGGLLAEAFTEHVDEFVSEGEKIKMKEAIARAAEVERLARIAEEVEEGKRRREMAAIVRRDARKAKNQLFSDDYHIYMDPTGFKHEITLTKVDFRRNRNERFVVTLYESNIQPPTFATNLHFAGTGQQPSNHVIAALGCNYATAFHAFKKAFREKTGVAWDDRVEVAVERAMRAKRMRVADSSLPVGEFFSYHPPTYGPRGELPEGTRKVFPEIGPPVGTHTTAPGLNGKQRDDIEMWMSGADGSSTLERNPGEDDFVHDAAPMAGGEEGGTDFDRFLSGAFAAANGDGVEDANDDGLGDTSYPFDSADPGATFGEDAGVGFEIATAAAAPANDNGMGAADAPAHTTAIVDMTADGEDDDAEGSEQEDETLPQTVPETYPSPPTSAAKEKEAQRHDTPSEEVPETQFLPASPYQPTTVTGEDYDHPRPAASSPPAATGFLGKTLNLGASILGKRKVAAVEELTTEQRVEKAVRSGDWVVGGRNRSGVLLFETEKGASGRTGDVDEDVDEKALFAAEDSANANANGELGVDDGFGDGEGDAFGEEMMMAIEGMGDDEGVEV